MSRKKEHENYILKSILSNSLSSENPSKETIEKAMKSSDSYFQRFKETLLEEYRDMELNKLKGSKSINTDYGETFKITTKEKVKFNLNDNNFKENIRKNLKLVSKVGLATEEKLKNCGYNTIDDLKSHDSYGERANKISKILEEGSLKDLMELVNNNKYSKECKNNLLKCASLVDKENFKFMDIETLGLSNVPIILIGVAEIKGNNIISHQYLLREKIEEPALLEGFLSHYNEDSVNVSFNGASFDFPFVKNRCNYYRIKNNLNNPHLDLLYFARNLWKDKLPNCRLQTIEKHIFNIERENDVPGQFIPSYYETYLEENNIGPLIPIIGHNRQDIVSLASFLMAMYDEVNY